MAEMTEYDPSAAPPLVSLNRPRPLQSLLGAAMRLTTEKITRLGQSAKAEAWQDDAWDMYDLVGEQRFLSNTLAGRLSQARFFVGRMPTDPTEDIVPLTDGPAFEVFDSLVGRGSFFTQMLTRLGINLFIPGDCYMVGIPPEPDEIDGPASSSPSITPIGRGADEGTIDITTLEWRVCSVSEITFDQTGEVTIAGPGKDKRTLKADDIMLIRVWRPHPRYWWQADSPTRSSLPVLRELVGLTMHISAQVDSRLAGAGLFLIPDSADRALKAQAGAPEEGDDTSPFTTALMEAMITPISDRSSASAVVPMMPVVPDESIEKFRYISFSTPLDTEARPLRDEAIRRLALGEDCPPELLLGVGGMNHWGAWLVREDVVTTHIEPPLSLIADAITTQFLWLVLEQQGVEDFQEYVVWYDVSHMIIRPDRSQDAKDLYAVNAIKVETLRDATGFDESDAPEEPPLEPAVRAALDLVKSAPTLAQAPGLPALVAQIRDLMAGVDPANVEILEPPVPPVEPAPPAAEDTTPPAEQEPPADGPPATPGGSVPPQGAVAASATPPNLHDLVESGVWPLPSAQTVSTAPRTGPIMIDVTHGGGGA